MPPKKKTRPPLADVALISAWLNSELSAAAAERQEIDVRAGVWLLSGKERLIFRKLCGTATLYASP